MSPMSRLALFATAFIIVVAIGTQTQSQTQSGKSLSHSICVCLPSRAAVFLKSAFVKTQTPVAPVFALSQ